VTPLIGSLLAGAASSAVRGLAGMQPILVVGPQPDASWASHPVDRSPVPDRTVVKIELNFNL
jgi:hypothetical protein